MTNFYTLAVLLVSIAGPVKVLAQGGNWGGGQNGGNRDGPWDQPPPSVAPIAQTTQAYGGETVGVEPTFVPVEPSVTGGSIPTVTDSNPQPTATNGGGGGGGGNGNGNCQAVQGNMNVQVSGDNVDFRFEPTVAGMPESGMTNDCAVWSFPPGWGGRVHVGGGSGAPAGGTLFEGNTNGASGAMDVSYVEGYSVSMMCTDNGNGFKSGCTIDLWKQGNTCPTGGSEGGICKNPQGPGGTRDSAVRTCEECSPPDPFFGPCAAAAYTFPFDDAAVDGQSSLDISCVIGAGNGEKTNREGDTATTGNPQAGRGCPNICSGSSKRDLEDVLFGKQQAREEAEPVSRREVKPSPHRTFIKRDAAKSRPTRQTLDNLIGKRSHRHSGVAHGPKKIRR
ncbi:MAG: hypothetical protein Q9190_005764 [Brigantiaea leucoxantha]